MHSLTVEASPAYREALEAVAELLDKLRIEYVFVGEVAVAGWFATLVDDGAVDVLAAVSPEGSGQIPMMAGHRGFIVSREDIEATQELDLIPLRFPAGENEIRIHVLIASNALYGNLIRDGVVARMGERNLRIVSAEDLALLLTVGGSGDDLRLRNELILRVGASFDSERMNRRMTAIGLGGKMIHR